MALIAKKVQKKLPEYQYIIQLYINSFPKEERIPLFLFKLASKRKNIDFFAFYDTDKHEKFVGFIYLLHYKTLSYLCFFAIDEKERGCGYGRKILQWLKQTYSTQTILLAIEEVDTKYQNYQERVGRRAFYTKNNFLDTNLLMIERKVRYSLLFFGREQSYKSYKKLFKRYALGFIPIRLFDNTGKKI